MREREKRTGLAGSNKGGLRERGSLRLAETVSSLFRNVEKGRRENGERDRSYLTNLCPPIPGDSANLRKIGGGGKEGDEERFHSPSLSSSAISPFQVSFSSSSSFHP